MEETEKKEVQEEKKEEIKEDPEENTNEVIDEDPTQSLVSPTNKKSNPIFLYCSMDVWVRLTLIILIVILTTSFSIFFHQEILQFFGIFLVYISKLGTYGFLLFMLATFFTTLFCIPSFIMTIASGYLYSYFAIPMNAISCTLGATFAFLLGRLFLKKTSIEIIRNNKKFEAIDKAMVKNSFKIIVLLRLIPITPFNFLNYVLGLSNISIWMYTLASFVGMLPEITVLVVIGTFSKNLKEIIEGKTGPNWTVELITYLLSGFIVIFVFLFIIYLARKELSNVMTKEEELEKNNTELQVVETEDPIQHEKPDNLKE